MRIRTAAVSLTLSLVLLGSAFAWQVLPRRRESVVRGGSGESGLRPFREYPGREYEDFPLPPDYREQTEWVFARLMYPQADGGYGFRRSRFGDNWREGRSSWTTDYPRAERHLAQAVRRLSRIHVRS